MIAETVDRILEQKRRLYESPYAEMAKEYRSAVQSSHDAQSLLHSIPKLIRSWAHDVKRGFQIGTEELSSSAVVSIGTPRYYGSHLVMPVYYGNGETKLLQVALTDEGYLVQHLGTSDRPVLIPFNNPRKAVDVFSQKVLYGGDKVRGVAKRLSGRYGMYGR